MKEDRWYLVWIWKTFSTFQMDIHLYCTGAPNNASWERWIGRCFMESNNPRGNILSNLQRIIRIFSSILLRDSSFNVVEHKSLKKWLISVRGFKTWMVKALNAIGSNVYMNTWQSWIFITWILPFSPSTHIAKLEL